MFCSIGDMHKRMEIVMSPVIQYLLFFLESFKMELNLFTLGVAQGATFVVPHYDMTYMAKLTICELKSIWIYFFVDWSLHFASCFERSLFHFSICWWENRVKACRMRRNSASDVEKCHFRSLRNKRRRAERWTNSAKPICVTWHSRKLEPDAALRVYRWRTGHISRWFYPTHRVKNLTEKDDTASFWAEHLATHKLLVNTTLRIFATPVSSSSSERDFSTVKGINTDSRIRLDAESIEDLVYNQPAIINSNR